MWIFDTNIRLYTLEYPFNNDPFEAPRINKASGNRVGFRLKELLKTAGWVVQASGDGLAAFSTTPGNANDVVTHEGQNANGMNNDRAWFVLKHPGSTRQLGFQITNFGTPGDKTEYWRIKYSYTDGITGGTPSPTEMPSATDEQFILGGGSDGSPFFQNWLNQSQNNGWLHIAADNAAPYGFWIGGYSLSTQTPIVAGVFDPLVPGTFSPSDLDPFAFYFSRGGDVWGHEIDGGNRAYAWIDGPNTGSWNNVGGLGYGSRGDQRITYERGSNPFNKKFDRMPLIWVDFNSNQQVKGQSSLMYWTNFARYQLVSGKTFQRATPRDTIQIGGILLPWNGTLPNR